MREMNLRKQEEVRGPEDSARARRATGESAGTVESGPRSVVPDPEVPEKARRCRFSGAYKLEILQAADACSQPGEIGALLRLKLEQAEIIIDVPKNSPGSWERTARVDRGGR